MEIATGNDVHADDGIVDVEVCLVNFLIGDGIAAWQEDMQQVGIALGLSPDTSHATLSEDVRAQFANECRGKDGGIAARVPHRPWHFHPALLVDGGKLTFGDNFVGKGAEADAKASHPVRGVQIPR